MKTITREKIGKVIEFRAEFDGVLVGYFASRHEAQVALDALVYAQLTH